MNGPGNLAGHGIYIRQVCIAGLALRRAYGNKNYLRRLRGVAEIGSELNLTAAAMPAQQFRKKFFMNGHNALVQGVHFGFVVINA